LATIFIAYIFLETFSRDAQNLGRGRSSFTGSKDDFEALKGGAGENLSCIVPPQPFGLIGTTKESQKA
jgi:hypothetical protein